MRSPVNPPPPLPELPALETRSYRLITPLFGGGVDAGTPDVRQAINGKTIRGQLRFWWRATRAAQFKSVKDMKAFEDYLWGCAASDARMDDTPESRLAQSRVQVTVVECRPEALRVYDTIADVPKYAAFPLQEPQDHSRPAGKLMLKGTLFSLRLDYPRGFWNNKNLELEVHAALWAWETFGGVGARTRRGFGAIERTDKPASVDWKSTLAKGFLEYVFAGEAPIGITRLSSRYKLVPLGWKGLIDRYKDFRQGEGFARKNRGSEKMPGRSWWPEPDAIRALTGDSSQKHKAPIISPHIEKFPRGQLGLPIIFKFKDDKIGDPKQTELKPVNFERLASPLLLRPLTDRLSVAIILETRGKPIRYEIAEKQVPPKQVALEITTQEAARISPLNGQTDVLQAALDHFPKENS